MKKAGADHSPRVNQASRLKPLSFDFAIRCAAWFTLIGLGFYFVKSGSSARVVLGTLLNGFMFTHGVELQHQCLHQSGFKSKIFNRLMGIVLGAPMFVSFSAYQSSHLWHHRYLGTPKDQEFFDYRRDEHLTKFGLLKYLFSSKRFLRIPSRVFVSNTDHKHEIRSEKNRISRDRRYIYVRSLGFGNFPDLGFRFCLVATFGFRGGAAS